MVKKILVIAFVIISVQLSAESVFLKDGSIFEGSVQKEVNKKIVLKLSNGTQKEFDKSSIIRVLYHDTYKDRRRLTKMDGSVMDVFIVDEEKDSYTYRIDLSSPKEIKIAKADVDSISKRKIASKYFKDNGNGTLTDTRTGLVWLKNANATNKFVEFTKAENFCRDLEAGGYDDWRMPTREEMEKMLQEMPSIGDRMLYLSQQGFENVQGTYWTSTYEDLKNGFLWTMSLLDGKINRYIKSSEHIYILPVRGDEYVKRDADEEKKIAKSFLKYIDTLKPDDQKQYRKEIREVVDAQEKKK
jgi:hypothetical protein